MSRSGDDQLPVTANAEIGPDTPLRLDIAVKLAFPAGGMDVPGLRKERDRGNLVVEKIANKEFTTLRNIEAMRGKCRVNPKEPACGSSPKNATATDDSFIAPLGSSVTERAKSGRAALAMSVNARKKNSANTSPANTGPTESAAVIRLKS